MASSLIKKILGAFVFLSVTTAQDRKSQAPNGILTEFFFSATFSFPLNALSSFFSVRGEDLGRSAQLKVSRKGWVLKCHMSFTEKAGREPRLAVSS
ncbi:hypothetical protein [Candidatus Regiella endosymbiont of Tuberolachnus salignus]|uniref:hypothetical protein n=1 Tax=Candidatus Regiella endosymbiont of Tuberolachnus salignus TaxID=3077956 RepID=UPI0030D53837